MTIIELAHVPFDNVRQTAIEVTSGTPRGWGDDQKSVL
jgi:hypothetical protein